MTAAKEEPRPAGHGVAANNNTTTNNSAAPAEGQPPPYSEDSLAQAFAARHAGTIKYVAAVNTRHRWFVWNAEAEGWRVDDTLYVPWLVRELCREASERCDDPVLARQLASAHTRTAVLSLIREDRRIAATKEEVGILPKNKAAKAVRP